MNWFKKKKPEKKPAPVQEYTCATCGRTFKTQGAWGSHMRGAHRRKASDLTPPSATRPNSPIPIPTHMRPSSTPIDRLQADLELIYTSHAARNMRLTGDHLVRRFQMDWNHDTLPIGGIRRYSTLPDLQVDGIPDGMTRAAVRACLEPNVSHEPKSEEPLLAPEEIVDDLQDLLTELED